MTTYVLIPADYVSGTYNPVTETLTLYAAGLVIPGTKIQFRRDTWLGGFKFTLEGELLFGPFPKPYFYEQEFKIAVSEWKLLDGRVTIVTANHPNGEVVLIFPAAGAEASTNGTKDAAVPGSANGAKDTASKVPDNLIEADELLAWSTLPLGVSQRELILHASGTRQDITDDIHFQRDPLWVGGLKFYLVGTTHAVMTRSPYTVTDNTHIPINQFSLPSGNVIIVTKNHPEGVPVHVDDIQKLEKAASLEAQKAETTAASLTKDVQGKAEETLEISRLLSASSLSAAIDDGKKLLYLYAKGRSPLVTYNIRFVRDEHFVGGYRFFLEAVQGLGPISKPYSYTQEFPDMVIPSKVAPSNTVVIVTANHPTGIPIDVHHFGFGIPTAALASTPELKELAAPETNVDEPIIITHIGKRFKITAPVPTSPTAKLDIDYDETYLKLVDASISSGQLAWTFEALKLGSTRATTTGSNTNPPYAWLVYHPIEILLGPH